MAGRTNKTKPTAANPRAAARAAREGVYREHILTAAEHVFAEKSFEDAKVQDISREAGLSMGSIYSLFPGKEQIFESITEKRGNEILALVRAVIAQERDPLETIEEIATTYIHYLHGHPHFLRMNLRTGAAWALTPRHAHHVAKEIHELQASVFARGIEAGVFVDDDPAYLATLLTGIDQIHLAHWVQTGMKQPRDSLRENFLRLVRRTFLRKPPKT
ncbi:MAG: TetR/AcrR family transcriptional regulator [Candidatus Binatia bacterium]|nr:TetR/AcrR family transcriptional regulator [Candidatus Binatia bacterium]